MYFRLVTPYSFVQFKVLTHNMVKKDSLLGEYKVDLYKVLKDNNGKITNFALALNIGDGNSDNSKLNVNLDGLKVDLTSYPPKQVSVQQNGKYVRLGLYSPIHLFLNFFRNTYIFKKALSKFLMLLQRLFCLKFDIFPIKKTNYEKLMEEKL